MPCDLVEERPAHEHSDLSDCRVFASVSQILSVCLIDAGSVIGSAQLMRCPSQPCELGSEHIAQAGSRRARPEDAGSLPRPDDVLCGLHAVLHQHALLGGVGLFP